MPSTTPYCPDWYDFQKHVERLLDRVNKNLPYRRFSWVYGIPTGGSLVALSMSLCSDLKMVTSIKAHLKHFGNEEVRANTIIVDDLVDSGATLREFEAGGWCVDTLFRKPNSPVNIARQAMEIDAWIQFPWEHSTEPVDAATRLLQHAGLEPTQQRIATLLRIVNDAAQLH